MGRAAARHARAQLLQSLHVSFGLLFAAVLVARIVWRLTAGRRLPRASGGIWGLAGSSMHVLLYVLMAAQVVLGFLFRWAQGEAFTFSACSMCPR